MVLTKINKVKTWSKNEIVCVSGVLKLKKLSQEGKIKITKIIEILEIELDRLPALQTHLLVSRKVEENIEL